MIKAVIFDMYETLITQYGGPVYFRAQMAADAGIDPMLFDALWIPSENDRTIGKQTLEETIEQILRQTGKYSEETFPQRTLCRWRHCKRWRNRNIGNGRRKKGSKSRLFLSSSPGNYSDASSIKRKKD